MSDTVLMMVKQEASRANEQWFVRKGCASCMHKFPMNTVQASTAFSALLLQECTTYLLRAWCSSWDLAACTGYATHRGIRVDLTLWSGTRRKLSVCPCSLSEPVERLLIGYREGGRYDEQAL